MRGTFCGSNSTSTTAPMTLLIFPVATPGTAVAEEASLRAMAACVAWLRLRNRVANLLNAAHTHTRKCSHGASRKCGAKTHAMSFVWRSALDFLSKQQDYAGAGRWTAVQLATQSRPPASAFVGAAVTPSEWLKHAEHATCTCGTARPPSSPWVALPPSRPILSAAKGRVASCHLTL